MRAVKTKATIWRRKRKKTEEVLNESLPTLFSYHAQYYHHYYQYL